MRPRAGRTSVFCDGLPTLGEAAFDAYPHDHAFRRNASVAVRCHSLGGYRILRKWLSYRERTILSRPLAAGVASSATDAVVICYPSGGMNAPGSWGALG